MSQRRESKRERTERLREERARETARERRRERIIRSVAAAVIVLVVVGVAVAFVATRESTDPNAALPTGVTEAGGGIPTGSAEGVPVVDVYEDFQCPACRAFEEQTGAALEQLAADGTARVDYHPMSFIGDESERAANAAACAADAGAFVDYHRILFEQQPGENTGQWTTDALVDLGQQVGITGEEFRRCVTEGRYVGWTDQVDEAAGRAGVRGTPTVLVNGEPLADDAYTAEGIRQAVAEAAQ